MTVLSMSRRGTANRKPHSATLAVRGFLPRRLSYTCRRPKLFTQAASMLQDAWTKMQTIVPGAGLQLCFLPAHTGARQGEVNFADCLYFVVTKPHPLKAASNAFASLFIALSHKGGGGLAGLARMASIEGRRGIVLDAELNGPGNSGPANSATA